MGLGSTLWKLRYLFLPISVTILYEPVIKEIHDILQNLAAIQSRFEWKFQVETPI